MEPYRFVFQENQFTGDCVPCTLATFYNIVRSGVVEEKITTRQGVEEAIENGLPLDNYIRATNFRNFCQRQEERPRSGAAFAALGVEKKLLQWVGNMKMWLPCFIFGVKEFGLVEKTDRNGNSVMDAQGQPVMYHRRIQTNIQELSGLFMFDADKLCCDPREIHERAMVAGFPWKVRLSHKTSSGHGLRLVCEALAEVGNIADNQIELARELGLLGMMGSTGKPVTDDSCIDATRISYAPRFKDIYFIDETHLFN